MTLSLFTRNGSIGGTMDAGPMTRKPFRLPLVLIAQVQRSGGTLLSQLFDGHPQVLPFPSELHIVKKRWPDLVHNFPKALSRHDKTFQKFIESGYHKYSIIDDGERHPFAYDIGLRSQIISSELESRANPTNRDFFDAFFSGFFGSWQRRQAVASDAICVTAFAAGTNIDLAKAERPGFFADYPDGHLITIVRNPLPWYASARLHGAHFELFSNAIESWMQSVRSSLLLRRRHPEQVTLLTFESIVTNTEQTMRALCKRLRLQFHPNVCSPTFDGAPIKSDSNFAPAHGIDKSVLHRHAFVPTTASERDLLDAGELLHRELAM